MLIRFIARGTGRPQRASRYLLAKLDSAGRPRPGVEVLRGDPDQVATVADSLSFQHRYTSGVIAWAPDDKPSDTEIDHVLDAFENTAWAGLEPDRYCWSAVLHREENGGCHIHILSARVDLATGKSLNIAPPGWQRTFDPLRDWLNAEFGWARPDDPERARDFQPGLRALAAVRNNDRSADPKPAIHAWLEQRIEAGLVQDRAAIVAAFQEIGFEVPRQGKNYVTVRDPDTGNRYRMKGQVYDQDFNAAEFAGPSPTQDPRGARPPGPGDRNRTQKLRAEFQIAIERRAQYHRKRYGSPEPAPEPPVVAAIDSRPEPLDRYLRRQLGDDAIPGLDYPDPYADAPDPGSGDRQATENLGRPAGTDRGDQLEPCPERHIHHGSGGRGPEPKLEIEWPPGLAAFHRLRAYYDRIGAELARQLEQAVEAIRRGAEAALQAGRQLVEAGQRLAEADRRLERQRTEIDRSLAEYEPDFEQVINRHHRKQNDLDDLEPPDDFF